MSEVIAFVAGVIVCRAFLGPIPRRAMDDIRMSAVALNHLSETTRRMLTAMQGIERQIERQANRTHQ